MNYPKMKTQVGVCTNIFFVCVYDPYMHAHKQLPVVILCSYWFGLGHLKHLFKNIEKYKYILIGPLMICFFLSSRWRFYHRAEKLLSLNSFSKAGIKPHFTAWSDNKLHSTSCQKTVIYFNKAIDILRNKQMYSCKTNHLWRFAVIMDMSKRGFTICLVPRLYGF